MQNSNYLNVCMFCYSMKIISWIARIILRINGNYTFRPIMKFLKVNVMIIMILKVLIVIFLLLRITFYL